MQSAIFFLHRKHGSKMVARLLVYLFGFLWSLAVALPLYIQSSYTEQYLSVANVGLYWAGVNAITVAAIALFPAGVRFFGNYRLLVWLTVVLFLSTLMLGIYPSFGVVMSLLLVQYVAWNVLSITNDILLEGLTDNRHTGRIRTLYLTFYNLAVAISPLIMGYLSRDDAYELVYIAAAVILVPTVVVSLAIRQYIPREPRFKLRSLPEMLNVFVFRRDLGAVFKVAVVLRLFYCIMVLYTPLYLHQYVGFSWEQIGVMFAIMLTPFVIFELPAGYAADRWWGEKELLVVGLIIMALASGALFFMTSANFVAWTIILFLSRVGAALVEAMQDTYFFKLVEKDDMDIINLFRDLNPLSWLMGSLLAFIITALFPVAYLFLFLSVIIIFALRPAWALRDTQ